MLTPRSSFMVGCLLLASLLTSALLQAADEGSLPDLGIPAANTATAQPNINAQGAGFNYNDNIDGKLISINPQYTKQNGVAVGGSLASPISKNMAVGILLTAGSDKNEWLLNTGFDLTSNQRFIFSLGQLRQKLDFNFISGNQKTSVRQDNLAASYQYFLGKNFLNAAEVNAYLSNTGSVTLRDKTYFTDTTSLYELWSDPRRIAGGRVSGVQGRLVFTPTSKTTIKVGLGAERLTYDYLTGNESSTRATGSAELVQRLEHDFNFRASANAAASQNRYALGLGKSFKGGSQLGLDVATIQGRDNTFNDNQVMLSYTQSLGGNASAYGGSPVGMNNPALNNLDAAAAPMNQASANTATPNPAAHSWASSLVDQVARRPSFLPAQVIAKIDSTATPKRLIAIDKTAVPTGSSIDTATGVITAPTGTPVSGIAGVTKNTVVFTNAGQFALSATGLVVNPKLITQPAVGVKDTYVVTMNNSSGGGTTLATVVVSHGSVKIDSIVMSSGIITPILSGFSLSAASVTFGTTTMPIITAPTSASSGAISYAVTGGTSTTKAVISSTGVISAIGSVGTTIITATQAADGNYATASTTATLTVTTTPSFTNFGAISKTYGDAAFDLIAPTSASSGAFTYTSSNPLVATISGSTVTVVGAGTSTITATQEANGNYAKANTTATLTVKKATPILTDFLPITKTLVDTPFNLTAPKSPSSGGFTYTYSIDNANGRAAATVTSLGKVTIAALGSSTITAIQAVDANYLTAKTTAKITVTLATPIITNFPSISKDLFDPLFNITDPKSTSDYGFQFTSSNKAVAIISGHEVRIKGVGTTTITAYQEAFGNYTDGSITATITVNRAPITTLDSGGLTWTRNNRTAGLSLGLPGTADWATANATCNTLTLDGFSWRLPTHAELTALYAAGTGPLTAAGWIMHSVWSSNIYTYNSHNVFNFSTGPTPFPFPADYGVDVGFYHVSCVHP